MKQSSRGLRVAGGIWLVSCFYYVVTGNLAKRGGGRIWKGVSFSYILQPYH